MTVNLPFQYKCSILILREKVTVVQSFPMERIVLKEMIATFPSLCNFVSKNDMYHIYLTVSKH